MTEIKIHRPVNDGPTQKIVDDLPPAGVSGWRIHDDAGSDDNSGNGDATGWVSSDNPYIPDPNDLNSGDIRESANPWVANPSYTCAFLAVMYDLLENMSKTRFTEAKQKQDITKFELDAGRELAELAKKLKWKEASKELVKAISSFIQAGISFCQLCNTAHSKTKAKETVAKEGKFQERLDKNKKDIEKLETEKKDQLTVIETNTKDGTLTKADEDKLLKTQTDLDIANQEKRKIEDERVTAVNAERQEQGQLYGAQKDLLSHITEGFTNIACSLLTTEMGSLEKVKEMINALMQFFNKVLDDISKNKEELGDQYNKICQSMKETREAYANASKLLSRG